MRDQENGLLFLLQVTNYQDEGPGTRKTNYYFYYVVTADRHDVEETILSVKVKVPGLPIVRRRLQGQGTIFFEIFFLKWRRLHGSPVAEVTWDKTCLLRLLRCLKIPQ